MNIQSIIVLVVLAVWFAAAVKYTKKNGSCGCGSSCRGCDGECSGCTSCVSCGNAGMGEKDCE